MCRLSSDYGGEDQVMGKTEIQRNPQSTVLCLPLSLVYLWILHPIFMLKVVLVISGGFSMTFEEVLFHLALQYRDQITQIKLLNGLISIYQTLCFQKLWLELSGQALAIKPLLRRILHEFADRQDQTKDRDGDEPRPQ